MYPSTSSSKSHTYTYETLFYFYDKTFGRSYNINRSSKTYLFVVRYIPLTTPHGLFYKNCTMYPHRQLYRIYVTPKVTSLNFCIFPIVLCVQESKKKKNG